MLVKINDPLAWSTTYELIKVAHKANAMGNNSENTCGVAWYFHAASAARGI